MSQTKKNNANKKPIPATTEVVKKDIPEVQEAVTFIGTVNVARLNLRSNPSVDAEVVDILIEGSKIEILEDCGEWYKTNNGFVMSEFIQI